MVTLNRIHYPKADVSRMLIPRKEGGRGMNNLEMAYKRKTISLNSCLQSFNAVQCCFTTRKEKETSFRDKKKRSKFQSLLNMAQKEIDINTKPIKAAKNIKKKKQTCMFRKHEKSMERETNAWKKNS